MLDDDGHAAAGGEGEGDLLLWILVWSELAAFGVLLAAFLIRSLFEPEAVLLAKAQLSPGLAALNTMILLTSGWQAAVAARDPDRARWPLVFAALAGLAFVVVKLHEYAGEIGFTGDAAVASFFELYFLITGFHLLHVLFGALVIVVVAVRPSRANVHLITTLWHAVDLIWIVMFPVIYLV